MDIVSRLKQYLDLRQISVTQFADSCGIPRPSVSQLLNGRNKKVSDEVISKIHAAYPDLSMLWLLFGEGDMASASNIKISEAQNAANTPPITPQSVNNQAQPQHIEFSETNRENNPDIFFENPQDEFDVTGTREVNFESSPSATSPYPWPSPSQAPTAQPANTTPRPTDNEQKPAITFSPDKGKRVVSIIVYYDDNSFEPFIPDPSGKNPFSR